MNESEIWCTARELVEAYGVLAIGQACDRLYELSAAGDVEGYGAWSRILALVNQMRPAEWHTGRGHCKGLVA